MLNLFYQGLFGEKLDERNDMGKIRIHCFETNGIEGFPSNTYQTDDVGKAVDCIRELLENERSGISRIVVENPRFGESNCYKDINCNSPMEI